ncbi:MAG: LPXTG cell wall anchor domain-containing protein [Enterococcus faecalis]|nr:LPXTG cell wall anchor domain-containing protein [Enterococcus faecalis]
MRSKAPHRLNTADKQRVTPFFIHHFLRFFWSAFSVCSVINTVWWTIIGALLISSIGGYLYFRKKVER